MPIELEVEEPVENEIICLVGVVGSRRRGSVGAASNPRNCVPWIWCRSDRKDILHCRLFHVHSLGCPYLQVASECQPIL